MGFGYIVEISPSIWLSFRNTGARDEKIPEENAQVRSLYFWDRPKTGG